MFPVKLIWHGYVVGVIEVPHTVTAIAFNSSVVYVRGNQDRMDEYHRVETHAATPQMVTIDDWGAEQAIRMERELIEAHEAQEIRETQEDKPE